MLLPQQIQPWESMLLRVTDLPKASIADKCKLPSELLSRKKKMAIASSSSSPQPRSPSALVIIGQPTLLSFIHSFIEIPLQLAVVEKFPRRDTNTTNQHASGSAIGEDPSGRRNSYPVEEIGCRGTIFINLFYSLYLLINTFNLFSWFWEHQL